MGKHTKTQKLIEEAYDALQQYHPMTVRQVYYRLVSRQVIKNNRSEYQAVSNALVYARQEGMIPWEWIEDRLRRPHSVSMWEGLADFADTAEQAYRRNVWPEQPVYVECWLEKDALSGVFDSVLEEYGVTLCVGRGYDGWSSLKDAAYRYLRSDMPVTVLYFGDHDPSGMQMFESLQERIAFFGDNLAEFVRCALNTEDIDRYDLPPDFAKPTDTRTPWFVQRYGDRCVELDALPPEVLEARIREEMQSRLDMEALERVKAQEEEEREKLVELLSEA